MQQNSQMKSPEAYKIISEVAKMLEITASTIRFWEKEFKQIKPTIINKRRYYSQENVKTIETIKELLYKQGYTLVGAKKYFKNLKATNISFEPSQSDLKLKIKKIISLLQLAKEEIKSSS